MTLQDVLNTPISMLLVVVGVVFAVAFFISRVNGFEKRIDRLDTKFVEIKGELKDLRDLVMRALFEPARKCVEGEESGRAE